MEMQLQTKDTLATLHLDPRTKLYLLIVGNVALFLAPSLLYEIALVVCVVILGILVGAKRFTEEWLLSMREWLFCISLEQII